MRRDEEGLWLTPREWLAWLYAHHPDRVFDGAAAEAAPTQAELDARERAEARQFRAGRAQGVLARTSPLAAERRGKDGER